MTADSATDLLWPALDRPDQLAAVEEVPLQDRDLPASTYAVLERRAALTPDRPVVTFLPEGGRYRDGITWTAAELLSRVRSYANALVGLGVPCGAAVGLLSTNCGQLLAALLAAETAAVAAPTNPGLAPQIGKPDKQALRRDAVRRAVEAVLDLSPDHDVNGDVSVDVGSTDDNRYVATVSGLPAHLQGSARDRLAALDVSIVLT